MLVTAPARRVTHRRANASVRLGHQEGTVRAVSATIDLFICLFIDLFIVIFSFLFFFFILL